MSNPYQPSEYDASDDTFQPSKKHRGPEYHEAREYWPTCPECGKRLMATCPICGTNDDLFPLGDTEYWDDDLGGSLVEYERDRAQQESAQSVLFGEGDTSLPYHKHRCSCNKMGKTPAELYGGERPQLSNGNDCCGKHGTHHGCHDKDTYCNHDANDETNDEIDPQNRFDRDYDKESLPFLVICPTCSEPFIPDFPGNCTRCHYVWDHNKVNISQNSDLQHTQQNVESDNRAEQHNGNPASLLIQLFVVGTLICLTLIVLAKILS